MYDVVPDTQYCIPGMIGFSVEWCDYGLGYYRIMVIAEANQVLKLYEADLQRLEKENIELKTKKLRMKYDNQRKEWLQC